MAKFVTLQVARQKWKQPFTRYELNKRTVKPNLQKFALWSTENLKVWVSTRALKSGKVERV